jgi:carbon-monoxide dehydrogenase medium subunit
MYRTALRPGELLVACEIPPSSAHARHGFAELARRHGDYAIVGFAANADMREGRFAMTNLVYFAAGDRPVLARAAAAALVGQPNTPEARQAALEALAQDLDPPSDLNADAPMRLHLARVLTRRVLEEFQMNGER